MRLITDHVAPANTPGPPPPLLQAAGEPSFSLPPAYSFTYPRLAGELYVGGVYVRLFLKTPKYAIRNPKRFVEGLLDR